MAAIYSKEKYCVHDSWFLKRSFWKMLKP